MPKKFQAIESHLEINYTKQAFRIRCTLKKINETRKIWILLTDKIKKVYLDEKQEIKFESFDKQKAVQLDKNTIRNLAMSQWINNEQDYTANYNLNYPEKIVNLKLFEKETYFNWYKTTSKKYIQTSSQQKNRNF